MAGEVVTVSSVKGGVGKTTITLALLLAGVKRGRKVIGVDLDPTGGLTLASGSQGAKHRLGHALRAPRLAVLDIWEVGLRRLDGQKVPGTLGVLAADPSLERLGVTPEALQEVVDQLRMAADLVVIDPPPNRISISGVMGVADRIVIPTELGFLSLEAAEVTARLALQSGVEARVSGVVISKARRPLNRISRRIFNGLNTGLLACSTVVWSSAEWEGVVAGMGVVPKPDQCEIADLLLGEVLGGFSCDQVALRAFAQIAPSHQEDV